MRTSISRVVLALMTVLVLGACSSAAAMLVNSPGQQSARSPGAPAGSAPAGGTATTAATSVVDRRVFVEGDSLTVGASPYLAPLLAAADWSATVDGRVGRDTATGISILATRESVIGGTLVVALGTNDPPDAALFSLRIDQLMGNTAGLRVIWVTVARAGWGQLDGALIAAQSRWQNLEVIDWRPIIALHPDMLAADGIHLTDAGYQLRAAFIAGAVEAAG